MKGSPVNTLGSQVVTEVGSSCDFTWDNDQVVFSSTGS